MLRQTPIRNSALNRNIKSPSQSEVFRRTMGQVPTNYWATVSPDEKRQRAQKSARARWRSLVDKIGEKAEEQLTTLPVDNQTSVDFMD